MRKGVLVLATGILAAAPCALLGQQGERPEDIVRAFHEALARGDSATALSLLAEDVLIYESGGVESSRDEYRSHHLPADISFARATEREVTVERARTGEGAAWVLSRSATTGTFREREIDSMGTETMLLELTSDGWRIRHIHWSSRRAPTPDGP